MAHYYFTRRAFFEIEEIYQYSTEHWGERVAQTYINDLYNAFQNIADNPQLGKQRQYRSSPYYMAPVGKHYAVFVFVKHVVGYDVEKLS